MKNTNEIKPQKIPSQLGKEKEFEYMLSELNHERRLIDERQRRLEQVIAFYLTITTAIIGFVIALTKSAPSITFFLLIMFASFAGSLIGHLVFAATINTLASIVSSHSHFYVRRQYFIDAFPEIKKYVENRPNNEIKEVWSVVYSRTKKLFIGLFAFFNCFLLGILVFTFLLTLITLIPNIKTTAQYVMISVVTPFSISITIFIFLGEIIFIRRRIQRAKEFSYRIFKNFPVEDKHDGNLPDNT